MRDMAEYIKLLGMTMKTNNARIVHRDILWEITYTIIGRHN